MKRYAVVGASSGTGREIVRVLASRGSQVRAISRRPLPAQPNVEPYAADVTDVVSLTRALDEPFDAVFYTVDIHGMRQPREAIRAVMYTGCLNAMQAALAGGTKRFVLLSVIGADQSSWVWWLLNSMKRGMQRNILDREKALEADGIPYVILRAPRLNDGMGNPGSLSATPVQHRLDMKMGIARSDLALALISAADAAPANSRWDVFSETRGTAPMWLKPDGKGG